MEKPKTVKIICFYPREFAGSVRVEYDELLKTDPLTCIERGREFADWLWDNAHGEFFSGLEKRLEELRSEGVWTIT